MRNRIKLFLLAAAALLAVSCDDPIAPDVLTETPLEDALAWLKTR
jgi:hypothetical protein